jgi:hypothetical protein
MGAMIQSSFSFRLQNYEKTSAKQKKLVSFFCRVPSNFYAEASHENFSREIFSREAFPEKNLT